jgi:hypothetical protein
MPLAQANTRGVSPAVMGGQLIPEIRIADNIALDDIHDIHFGLNIDDYNNPLLYADLDVTVPMENDLIGLGARTIDIKRRGGRTAEDDWEIYGGDPRARGGGGMQDGAKFQSFNQARPITSHNFPAGARQDAGDVAGNPKGYHLGATNKFQSGGLQMGTRWSKTALEYALAHGTGHIHFHLDGMGELSGIFDKTGDYGYNVTSRELRYVKRFWQRFQHKVIFYNGYAPSLLPVIVCPPWIPEWEPDTATNACRVCNNDFSRAFPVRWRHHCRLCGRNVCDDCSPNKVRLMFPVQRPGSARENGLVRVCTPCYQAFNRGLPAPI